MSDNMIRALLPLIPLAGLLWWLHWLQKPLVRRVITRGSATPARRFWLKLFDPQDDSEILAVFKRLGLRTGDATPKFLCLYYDPRKSTSRYGPIGIRFRPPLATVGAWQREDVLAEIRAATGLSDLRVYGKSVQRSQNINYLHPRPPIVVVGPPAVLRERFRRHTPDELILIWS